MLKQSIPFIFYDEDPVGWMDYNKWSLLEELLFSINLTTQNVDVDEIFINDFVEHYYE
jgi:hypothetical protein